MEPLLCLFDMNWSKLNTFLKNLQDTIKDLYRISLESKGTLTLTIISTNSSIAIDISLMSIDIISMTS